MLVWIVGTSMLLAALVPSGSWLELLRGSSPGPAEKLLLGATLFRLSLAATGAYALAGAYCRWWIDDQERLKAAGGLRGRRSGFLQIAVASALLLTGAALRLYSLDQGLWVDEVTTLVGYVRPPMGVILTSYGSNNQHLLFSALAHVAVGIFGEAAWSLRLPAALFGIVTLWAFWRLANEVTTSREALLGMAMLTFSYQHIWFSQNARGYSALLCWTIVSTTCLVRAIRTGSGRSWLGYAFAVALGMFTHLTMVFVVLGQAVVCAIEVIRRRDRSWAARLRPFTAGLLPAGLLTLTAYALVLPQIPDASAADLSDVATWRSLSWMLQEIGRGLAEGPLAGLIVLAGLVVFCSGMVSFWRQSAMMPLLFVVPVVTGAVAMVALGHHLWPRFFFFAAGFGVLFVVRGLTVVVGGAGRVLRMPPRRATVLATLVSVLAVGVLARSLPYVYRPKQDYGGARDFIEAARQPGDAVVSIGVASMAFRMYYAPGWATASSLRELEDIESRASRTWLVYTLPIEMESSHPDILAKAQRDFRLVRTFDGSLGGGAIYVWLAGGRPPGVVSAAGSGL